MLCGKERVCKGSSKNLSFQFLQVILLFSVLKYFVEEGSEVYFESSKYPSYWIFYFILFYFIFLTLGVQQRNVLSMEVPFN